MLKLNRKLMLSRMDKDCNVMVYMMRYGIYMNNVKTKQNKIAGIRRENFEGFESQLRT